LAQCFEQKNPFFFLKNIKKRKSSSAKGQSASYYRLSGWISENVFLWDKIALEMKMARAGHLEKLT